MPDKRRARAGHPGSDNNSHHDDGHDGASASTVPRPGDEGARAPRWLGCPCGHDPASEDECIRHRPLGAEVDYLDSPIGVVDQGGWRVTSLREWRWAS